ncbi:hypothetical protein [Litorivivens sp.]
MNQIMRFNLKLFEFKEISQYCRFPGPVMQQRVTRPDRGATIAIKQRS